MSHDEPILAEEIAMDLAFNTTEMLDRSLRSELRYLADDDTAWRQPIASGHADPFDDLIATLPCNERHRRLLEHIGRQARKFGIRQIGRVRHQQVDVAFDRGRQWVEQISDEHVNGKAQATCVQRCNRCGIARRIHRVQVQAPIQLA